MFQNPNLTRIGVSDLFELPPHAFACGNLAFNRSAECRMPGYDADIIDYFFKLMKRPYELVNCGRVFGMIYLNGTATDCMESFLNGTIDMLGGTFFPTAARREHFSLSMPVHMQSFTVMAPTKEETFFFDHLTKLLTPFTLELWIVFFMCFCSVMIVKIVHNFSLRHQPEKSETPLHFDNLRGFSFRHLATSWAITSMVCLSLYRCFLLSTMMMNTSPSTPIHDYNSLVDMIKSNQAVLYVHEIHMIIGEQIMKEESLYELREALVENPIVMTNYFDKAIQGVEGHMAVMILETGVAEYTARRSCNVNMFKIDLQSNEATTLSFLFSKNISFLPELNSLIQNKPSSISHMISYYTTTDRDEICRASHTLSTPKYMSTETFVAATVFLLVGGVMGASVLIAEWFICRHLNKT